MSSNIKYRIAARTEAAGKYSPSAPQEGNEDNYGLILNLQGHGEQADFDTVSDLGDYGIVMFVADGMGGHNAGEVASRIAVETVSAMFDIEFKPDMALSHESRAAFMESVIKEADSRIRQHSPEHSECKGMGSTIVIAWLVGSELSVSWCGDSRAYLYIPEPSASIRMVSEDHSYVQELVRRGVIPYEATFAHPQGNIVTRCLGDDGSHAQPESSRIDVAEGDIIMLCSDGLSGVVFDDGRTIDGAPLSPENLCDTITTNRESMRQCCEALFAAAERCGWYDNVTAIVCEIVKADGVERITPTVSDKPLPPGSDGQGCSRKRLFVAIAIAVLLLLAIAAWIWIRPIMGDNPVEIMTEPMSETIAPPTMIQDTSVVDTAKANNADCNARDVPREDGCGRATADSAASRTKVPKTNRRQGEDNLELVPMDGAVSESTEQ